MSVRTNVEHMRGSGDGESDDHKNVLAGANHDGVDGDGQCDGEGHRAKSYDGYRRQHESREMHCVRQMDLMTDHMGSTEGSESVDHI